MILIDEALGRCTVYQRLVTKVDSLEKRIILLEQQLISLPDL